MKTKLFVVSAAVCLVLVAAVLAFAAKQKPANWPKAVSIAAATVGTGNYSLAAGMANLISKHAGIRATPEASSVGGRTLYQLQNKEVEFAVSFSDQAYQAGRGIGPYKKGKMNIRQVWMGTVAPLAMITYEGSGVKSFQDLKGKRVMDRYSGNLTFESTMNIFMEAEGMAEGDVKHTAFTGWKDGTSALTEKRIAAFIHPYPSDGMPSWLKELSMEIQVRLFSVDEKKIDAIQKKYRFMKRCVLSAKDYGPITYNKDLPTISPFNSMFCRAGSARGPGLRGDEGGLRSPAGTLPLPQGRQGVDR